VEAIGRHRAVKVVGAVAPDQLLNGLASLEADVVVVDVAEVWTRENLARIVSALPEVPVIAIGVPPLESAVVACAEAGASGLVPEDASFIDFLRTVANTVAADAPDSTVVAEILLRKLRARVQEAPSPRPEGLTRREREIAEAIAEGLTNKQIAERFFISVPTVKSHVHCILRKLGVERRGHVRARLRELNLDLDHLCRAI
jgi:DNA-binding NarL/FixJ family response regulator